MPTSPYLGGLGIVFELGFAFNVNAMENPPIVWRTVCALDFVKASLS